MENEAENAFPLLEEFEIPTMEQWKAMASSQLKGASFEKSLISDTPEGIAKRPIYTADDVEEMGIATPDPGLFPYVRGSTASGYFSRSCKTGVRISGSSPSALNRLLKSLPKRKDALLYLNPVGCLGGESAAGGFSYRNLESLSKVLQDVDVASHTICLDAGERTFSHFGLLISHLRASGIPLDKVRGCIVNDPYGTLLLQKGRHDIDEHWRKTAGLLEWNRRDGSRWSLLGVDGRIYRECGGNIAQEIAYSLASAVETTRELLSRGFTADAVIGQIHFNVAVGSDFFMEIAKFRAMRTLWAQIAEAYDANVGEGPAIYAFSSLRNKSLYDPHVNILRTTTEALSAILGGADAICLVPFDFLTEKSNEMSSRLALNVSHIIREEGFCDRVIDPAGGSWMVESIAHRLGEKAWSLFQEIEREGGICEAIKAGSVRSRIESSAQSEMEDLRQGRKIFVGSNRFEDPSEVPKELSREEAEQSAAKEKTAERERTLTEISERIAASQPADGPNANLFESVIETFCTGAAVEEVERALAVGATGSKGMFATNNRPLRMQRATEQVERARRKK